jgi:hypothetical protein
VHQTLCSENICRVESRDGRPLYYDDDHLSFAGGRAIVPALELIFQGRARPEVGSLASLKFLTQNQ